MQIYRNTFLLVLVTMFSFALPVWAQQTIAPTTCACFCQTESGAVQISDDKVTSEKCESLCEKSGSDLLVCAKSTRQYPGNNALCFSAAHCAEVNGKLGPPNQAPECSTGMTYCFPDSQKVEAKLNVKIGALETVGDLGVYIDAVYKWMLGVAGMIAVVMIMIGGLQWVLSAGGMSSIAKAKEKIKNGIVGVLLLLSVVLILQTVNPELLKLQVPRPSLLRQITLTANSCEKLIKEGHTIETEQDVKKECGTSGIIKKDPLGKQVADGLTCQFTKCAKGACVGGPGNEQCIECRNVSAGNPNSPANASPAVCKMMEIEEYSDEIVDGTRYLKNKTFCTFGKGSLGGLGEYISAETEVVLKKDSCLETKLDCATFTDCSDYNKLKSYTFSSGESLFFTDSASLSDISPSYFNMLCSSDPCGVKRSSDIAGCTIGILGCSNISE